MILANYLEHSRLQVKRIKLKKPGVDLPDSLLINLPGYALRLNQDLTCVVTNL